jgi:hypothetical protein
VTNTTTTATTATTATTTAASAAAAAAADACARRQMSFPITVVIVAVDFIVVFGVGVGVTIAVAHTVCIIVVFIVVFIVVVIVVVVVVARCIQCASARIYAVAGVDEPDTSRVVDVHFRIEPERHSGVDDEDAADVVVVLRMRRLCVSDAVDAGARIFDVDFKIADYTAFQDVTARVLIFMIWSGKGRTE